MDKQGFIDYIKRKLGEPHITVEITDEQIEDILQDCIDIYSEWHYESTINQVIILDLKPNQTDYYLPKSVVAIEDVMQTAVMNLQGIMNLVPVNYVSNYSIYNMRNNYNIEAYYQYKVQRDLIDYTWHKNVDFDYNTNLHLFRIMDSNLTSKYKKLGIVVKSNVIAESIDAMYNDRFFRELVVNKCGIQWGDNITKYSGAKLPGGAELNGDSILNKYEERYNNMIEELKDTYQEPIGIFMG